MSLDDLDVYTYIDKIQRLVYRSSRQRITPRECLRMNLSEIAIVLEEGIELQNERMIIHADMKASVLNAPHFHKKNHEPYKLQEFIPKNLVNSLKQEIRPEDQARLIQERGDALAAKCRLLKKG